MTKPIHPRPNLVIIGQKPKRIRRTKAQMAASAADASLKAQWAALLPLAQKRLAEATAGQRRAATRTINAAINGPKYRWEK